jgi:hypothetical protein
LIDLIDKVNQNLTNHILFIIANLTSRNSTSSKEFILSNTKLLPKLLDYLLKVNPNFVRRTLLWNISNVITFYQPEDKKIIVNALIENYLKNPESTRAVLREALIVLVGISENASEDNLNMLYESKIYETALEYLKAISEGMDRKDIILQVKLAKILTNLTMGKVKQIRVKIKVNKEILNHSFIDTYEDLIIKILNNVQYENDYKLLVKEIIACICNLVGTNENLTSIIVKDCKLCKLILQLEKQHNADNSVIQFSNYRSETRL